MLEVTENQKSEANGDQRADKHHEHAPAGRDRGGGFLPRHLLIARRILNLVSFDQADAVSLAQSCHEQIPSIRQ